MSRYVITEDMLAICDKVLEMGKLIDKQKYLSSESTIGEIFEQALWKVRFVRNMLSLQIPDMLLNLDMDIEQIKKLKTLDKNNGDPSSYALNPEGNINNRVVNYLEKLRQLYLHAILLYELIENNKKTKGINESSPMHVKYHYGKIYDLYDRLFLGLDSLYMGLDDLERQLKDITKNFEMREKEIKVLLDL